MRHARRSHSADDLARAYLCALSQVEAQGFAREIDHFFYARPLRVTESVFLREYAWVVLNSGFRESVIRRLFQEFSQCFLDWRSAQCIVDGADSCERSALHVFGNVSKVRSILGVCRVLAENGLEKVFSADSPPFLFTRLPYIGKVTTAHLLKNLGISVAKEDRHLARLAASLGFRSGQRLCECIAEVVGHPVSAVDTVLWRFSTLSRSPCRQFSLMAE